MKNKQSNNGIGVIGAVLILAAVLITVGGGFFAYQYFQ